MSKLYIPVILGTAREGRQSEKAALFMRGEAEKFGFETEIIDVRDFRIPATDNTQKSPTAKKLAEKVTRADGYIIVSPEYNHGYPGELKMALDLLYQQFARKPAGICGVSAGPLGGARATEQLRLVAVELHMVPIREAVYFPDVYQLFDSEGKPKDVDAYRKKCRTFFEELAWYAGALKAAREKKS